MFDNDHLPPAGDGDGMPYAQEPVRYEPEFTGRAGEFFGIWFVNLSLSILTLGIYSAWAKVRTERYFYGNTRLAGAAFEYFASPIAILKGRLIAYAVVAVLVIRLTAASSTPGVRSSTRCTRAWQAAHVIPETGMFSFADAGRSGRTAIPPVSSSATLRGLGRLVPGVGNRVHKVADGGLAFVVRDRGRSDADGLDFHARYLAKRLTHGAYAVSAAHA